MIKAHISKHSKWKLAYHFVIRHAQIIHGILSGEEACKLGNSVFAEERFNTIVVECKIDKGLEKRDEILSFLWCQGILVWMSYETKDHLVGAFSVSNAFTATGSYT